MQNIRNNKQIKHKNNTIMERILAFEGKIAINNIKRNKSKYVIITILLVICMTSYIVVSTYIQYEKETAKIVNKYDSDAKLIIDSTQNINYKKVFSIKK